MDPITKAYLEVLNESVPSSEVKTDLKVGAAFGDKTNEKNVTTFIKGSGPDEVEGVENAEEAPDELTSDVDSSLKKMSKESKNPFDALFNKIVSEETFNFSTEPNNQVSSDAAFDDSSLDMGSSDSEDSDVDEFLDSDEDSDSAEVTLTIDKEMAEKLMEILSAAMGEEGEEESDEMEEEEEDEDQSGEMGEEGEEASSEEDEEDTYPESFALDDADELGEPLVDVEKLNSGLTNPKNIVVSGNIKAKKKTAETPQVGKGSDGKLKSHNVNSGISKLTKKKQDVHGVNKGKMMFDNK